MSDLTYKLSIQSKGIFYKNDDAGTVDIPVSKESDTPVTYSNISMKWSLCGVSFHRKVYEPGHIQAEMLIKVSGEDQPTVDLISLMLLRRTVSLYVNATEVAKNYYIHEILPQFEKSTEMQEIESEDDDGRKTRELVEVSVTFIYVKLDIFSLDKLLTLNKYSQAHIGRKLFSDIAASAKTSFPLAQEFVVNGQTDKDSVTLDTNVLKLYHLGYSENSVQEELIHPYLVQYNETFYDFLTRVANRSGEVFYFEDGALCFGISGASSPTPVTGANRVIFQRISNAPISIQDYARDSVKQWDATNKTYSPGENKILSDPVDEGETYPTDAFPKAVEGQPGLYNSEIASEDHYVMLFKNKFARDSVNDLWCGDAGEHAMSTLSLVLNSTSLLELITTFGVQSIDAAIKSAIKKDKQTDKGNEKLEEEALDSDNDYAVLYAKVDNDLSHWITLKYASDIKAGEQKQMNGMVCVDMGSGFTAVKLGDKISIPNDDKHTYVVVQIEMSSANPWQRSYEGFGSSVSQSGQGQSQLLYAIPLDDNDVFFPPLQPGRPFRQCGPQPAFVIDSDDPVGQGRVRIRYPWQPSLTEIDDDIEKNDYEGKYRKAKSTWKEKRETLEKYAEDITEPATGDASATKKDGADKDKFNTALSEFKTAWNDYRTKKAEYDEAMAKRLVLESATPWIRMSTPMATSGGGMFFRPEVGDEVMVDYENGNVERPYVTGTLYSKNVPAPHEGERVIVSRNGHTIKMSDPSNAKELLAGLFPAAQFLMSFGVKNDSVDKDLEGKANKALGGIELTDQLGFYTIKMSSHERNITISCPFGNVKMNALTGISISAPNGDISIVGKNISLKAFDKISLSSGNNIKLADGSNRGGWLTAFANPTTAGKSLGKALTLFSAAKFFDLSLIRTLLEIVIRPVDGALQISSGRFLLLEAGEGSAEGDRTEYNVKLTDPLSSEYDSEIFKDLVKYVVGTVASWKRDFIAKYNAVLTALVSFRDAWTVPPGGGSAPITTPADRTTLLHDMFALNPDNFNTDQDYMDKVFEYYGGMQFDNTLTALQKMTWGDQVNPLMKAAVALKKQMLLFDHVFDKIKDGSFFEGDASLRTRAKSRVKASVAQEAQTILALPNPVVPYAPVVHPAGTKPDYANVAPNARADRTVFAGKLDAIKDFVLNGNGQDTVFTSLDGSDLWMRSVVRRVLCMLIEKCRDEKLFEGFMIPQADYTAANSAPNNLKYPFSRLSWTKYINAVKIMEPSSAITIRSLTIEPSVNQKKFAKGLVGGFLEAPAKFLPYESDTWSPEKKGKILFSDSKDQTVRFDNAGATHGVPNLSRVEKDEPVIMNVLRNT